MRIQGNIIIGLLGQEPAVFDKATADSIRDAKLPQFTFSIRENNYKSLSIRENNYKSFVWACDVPGCTHNGTFTSNNGMFPADAIQAMTIHAMTHRDGSIGRDGEVAG